MTGIRQYLIDILKRLESAIPPPKNCHHAITYAQYGSDETGWEDRLALQVNSGGKFFCFFLDEDDTENDPQRIIDFIVADISSKQAQSVQMGFGMGQYLPVEGEK